MNFTVHSDLNSLDVDTLVVPVPDGSTVLAEPFTAVSAPLFRSGDLPLKSLETVIHHADRRTVFIGFPKSPDIETWRRVGATVVRRVRKSKAIAFAGGDVQGLTEGVLTGSFSTELYKSTPNGVSSV